MAIELRRVYEDVNDWRLDAWIVEDDEPSVAEVIEWLIERGAAVVVPWCGTHDSEMQQTICAKHDLACRRTGRNPFAGKPKCRLEEPARVLRIEEQ